MRPQLLGDHGRRQRRAAPAPGRWRQAATRDRASAWPSWWAPVALAVADARAAPCAGDASALFFSKLAVVSFGGAYAVLAYMAQQAVETYGWMTRAGNGRWRSALPKPRPAR